MNKDHFIDIVTWEMVTLDNLPINSGANPTVPANNKDICNVNIIVAVVVVYHVTSVSQM